MHSRIKRIILTQATNMHKNIFNFKPTLALHMLFAVIDAGLFVEICL